MRKTENYSSFLPDKLLPFNNNIQLNNKKYIIIYLKLPLMMHKSATNIYLIFK